MPVSGGACSAAAAPSLHAPALADKHAPLALSTSIATRAASTAQAPPHDVQYELPEAVPNVELSCPVAHEGVTQSALPLAAPAWQLLNASLLEPSVDAQLEADRAQRFSVAVAPAAVEAAALVARNRVDPPVDTSVLPSVAVFPMDVDSVTGKLSVVMTLPRRETLELMVRRVVGGPWERLLRFAVRKEVQHLRARPITNDVHHKLHNNKSMNLVRPLRDLVSRLLQSTHRAEAAKGAPLAGRAHMGYTMRNTSLIVVGSHPCHVFLKYKIWLGES
jgi:hypothetical protein